MKKIQGLFACAAAVAAGVSLAQDPVSNGVTPFDSLKLNAAANAFSAEANGTSETVTGCTVTPVSGKVTIADSYYVIESELTDTTAPLVVTQSPKATDVVEKFDIAFKASFVDEGDLSGVSQDAMSGVKMGFVLTSATTAKVYDGSQWSDLAKAAGSCDLSVTEDTAYTLHVDYDARETKARFVISTTPAYTSDWAAVSAIANNSIAVLGSGSVKSLAGATYSIAAEVVVITPAGESKEAKINIPPADMSDIAAKLGVDPANPTAVANGLNTVNAANGNTELTNYILFGKVGSDITASDKPTAKGVKAANASMIAVAVAGLSVKQDVGATVKYQLRGSTDNSSWHDVGEAQDSATFEFEPSEDRYFKVQAIIKY